MKIWDKDYRTAMSHFYKVFCPRCGMQLMLEGCDGCDHYCKHRIGGRVVSGRCIHPKHPRLIDGLHEYVLEAL